MEGYKSFHIEDGYSPNSHDCMPNELINYRLKENVRLEFAKVKKKRQTVKRLEVLIHRLAESFDADFVRERIACLPEILSTIVSNKGGQSIMICAGMPKK